MTASGDLRYVVKTVAGLLEGLTNKVDITMNDRQFEVVARNTIFLLLAFTTDDTKTSKQITTEAIIHL